MQSLSYERCFIGFTFALEIDQQGGGEDGKWGAHLTHLEGGGGYGPRMPSLGAGPDHINTN